MTRATSLNRGLLALPGAATTRRAFLVGLGSAGLGACASNPIAGSLRATAGEPAVIPPEFREWIATFRPRALGRGISAATYDRVMNEVVPEMSVFKSDSSQPETVEPIWRYVDKRTNEYNVTTGRKRIQEYAALWDRIEERYGVDRYLLCALWGLESSFGDLVISTKYMKPVMN